MLRRPVSADATLPLLSHVQFPHPAVPRSDRMMLVCHVIEAIVQAVLAHVVAKMI